MLSILRNIMKTFCLNEKERMKYVEFCSDHCGTVEIIFTPGGIGDKVELHCKGCGKRVDITDYDCW